MDDDNYDDDISIKSDYGSDDDPGWFPVNPSAISKIYNWDGQTL
jgi:hypothetical protein